MPFMEFGYYSKALSRRTVVNIILPDVRKMIPEENSEKSENYKTLYLYHGLTDDCNAWIRKSNIERYAEKYSIAVVMPEVGRSWYTDICSGEKYFTFVSKELPEVCRSYFKGMSAERADNFVAGLSMGGYGAMKVALSCPDDFGGVASLSGSLDITRKNRPVNLPEWRAIFDFNMESPIELEGGEHDLYALVCKNRKNGKAFPKMYLWCGTEDNPGLLQTNRRMHDTLIQYNIEHTYNESEGDHSWKWWDLHIQDALEFLFGQ